MLVNNLFLLRLVILYFLTSCPKLTIISLHVLIDFSKKVWIRDKVHAIIIIVLIISFLLILLFIVWNLLIVDGLLLIWWLKVFCIACSNMHDLFSRLLIILLLHLLMIRLINQTFLLVFNCRHFLLQYHYQVFHLLLLLSLLLLFFFNCLLFFFIILQAFF